MRTVRPKLQGAGLGKLPLTPEEGFVLSRIDGRLSVRELVALTGIEERRVEQIVTKLASHGAVMLDNESGSSGRFPASSARTSADRDSGGAAASGVSLVGGEAETTSFADYATALGLDPGVYVEDGLEPAIEQPVPEDRIESHGNAPSPHEEAAEIEAARALGRRNLASDGRGAIEEAADGALSADDASTPDLAASAEDGEVSEEAVLESETTAAENERQYRQIYETRFHPLPTDARVHLAKTAHGADLMALCLDADPRVIAAILENSTAGLDHVRLIAFHHRSGTGLEMISRRSDYIRDALVERRLLRNPQSGDPVLARIFASKRVFHAYKIAIDREVPELTRAKGRGFVRQKFQKAPPEERADFILRTEGRCLMMMTGCTFDAKMTSILCSRPYNSVLFIQNLAKFSATPPALLGHLMRQPFVRKNQPLRKLLLQHPNMPGDMKRQP